MASEALVEALRHVWRNLSSLQIPAALMGGIAMAAWKHVRATRDIDVLISVTGQPPQRVCERLQSAGIRPKGGGAAVPFGGLRAMPFLYEPPETFVEIQIDLFAATTDYHEQALRRRVPFLLPGSDLRVEVLTCEDLILHKLLAGRIIDRADVAALLRANQEGLDFDYLISWSQRLTLIAGLSEAWSEGLPETPFPPSTGTKNE